MHNSIVLSVILVLSITIIYFNNQFIHDVLQAYCTDICHLLGNGPDNLKGYKILHPISLRMQFCIHGLTVCLSKWLEQTPLDDGDNKWFFA